MNEPNVTAIIPVRIDSKDRQSIDQILGERVVIIKDFR